ncbi:hypothetical protein B0H13DRAFT_1930120 [Mycena leptocephala]|nr:hypothetical protein B0H13DRAFT_1930120 [Mycena leptocephala]
MSSSSSPATNTGLYVKRRRAYVACTNCRKRKIKARLSMTARFRGSLLPRYSQPGISLPKIQTPPHGPNYSDPWRAQLLLSGTAGILNHPSPPPPAPQPIQLPCARINSYMGTNPPALSGAAPPSPRYPYPHRAGPPSAPPPVSTSSAAFVYQSPPQHSLSGHPQAGLGSMKHPLAAAAPDHYPGSASYLLPPNTGHPYGLSYNQNYGPAYVPQPGGTTSPWLPAM